VLERAFRSDKVFKIELSAGACFVALCSLALFSALPLVRPAVVPTSLDALRVCLPTQLKPIEQTLICALHVRVPLGLLQAGFEQVVNEDANFPEQVPPGHTMPWFLLPSVLCGAGPFVQTFDLGQPSLRA
jgi:hypothetical protein